MNIVKKFTLLKNVMMNTANKISSKITKRVRSVHFKDIFYVLIKKNYSGNSYDTINNTMKIISNKNVSKTALIKQQKKVTIDQLETLNEKIINLFPKNRRRLIAVDGSKINLSNKLSKNEYPLSKNKNYCTGLISSLYDITYGVPLNYSLFNVSNERNALEQQMKYVSSNDILIMDRGYFSQKLLKKLTESRIDCIFRLKDSLKIVKDFKCTNKNESIIDYYLDHDKKIKFKLIHYKINKCDYYIGTTLTDSKYNVNYFKDIYWKRWKIETDFRYAKYILSLENLKSKSELTVKQDICIHNFILLVEGYIEHILSVDTQNTDNIINNTNGLTLFTEHLLDYIFYKKINKKAKIKILNLIINTQVVSKKNRKYTRIRKFPASKWCLNAIKFINHFNARKKK